MATVNSFEDLIIWKDARILVNDIYRSFNKLKDFGFRDQIQRASVSIMNNIAEGFEKESDKDFKRFLVIAKASAGEVRSMIYLAQDLNYIDDISANNFIKQSKKLSGSIANFINYLKKS